MQIDRHFRVFGKKLRQERRHLPETEGHGYGETYEPARASRLGNCLTFGSLTFGKDACGAIQEELAGVRPFEIGELRHKQETMIL